MLEEKGMGFFRFLNFHPVELMPAFRTARLDQATQVVFAERAENVLLNHRPIGRWRTIRRRSKIAGCCHAEIVTRTIAAVLTNLSAALEIERRTADAFFGNNCIDELRRR